MTFKEVFESEVAVNNAGDGQVHGIGVGPKGEPGIKPRRVKQRTVLRGLIGSES